MIRFFMLFCVAVFFFPVLSFAADQPIEVTADADLEWDRVNRTYTARGNAIARQADFSVKADVLTAEYAGSDEGSITRLTAKGHVELTSGESKGFGDSAVYDVPSGEAVLKGKDVRLKGPDLSVQGREQITYNVGEGRIVGTGRLLVAHGGDTLEADKVVVWLWRKGENSSGRAFKKAEGTGNVAIHTSGEESHSDSALYDATRDIAELEGHVRILRGPHILEGDHAEMDLSTKISRLVGTGEKTGRVKGVFFPGAPETQKGTAPGQ